MINESGKLKGFYKDVLQNDLMRFWNKAFDEEYGGYYTCFSNDGKKLVSTDKYIWSQGRMLWIVSHYVDMIRKGMIEDEEPLFLHRAEKTYRFLKENAILPEDQGVCAYLCKKDGTKMESIPGKGYYTSFYVDCFVIMGFAEWSRVCGKTAPLEEAVGLYQRTRSYLKRNEIVSEPYPIPDHFLSHSVPMIMSNVTLVLYQALKAFDHPAYSEVVGHARDYVSAILDTHIDGRRRVIREMVPTVSAYNDTLLALHVNPGHAIESMWFCVKILQDTGWMEGALEKIKDVVRNSIEIGWDAEMGGLYRFVGIRGGKPEGRLLGNPYESLLTETWDSKLWWPHSEALYSTLLCYQLTGDTAFKKLYDMVSEYVFRVFPNPDREVGEWIQILDRCNKPMNKVVALPVKDPYHIMRDVMLIIELLSGQNQKQ